MIQEFFWLVSRSCFKHRTNDRAKQTMWKYSVIKLMRDFFFKRCKVLNLQVEPFYVKIQWCWFLARTWKSWEKYQEQLLSKGRLVFEVGVNWQQGVSLWSWVFNSCYLVTMKTPARRKHCSLMGIHSPSLFHSLSQGISTVCPVLEHLCTAWKVPMFAV